MPATEDARTTEAVDWRRRCEALLGVPASEGNRVEILRNGAQIFPAMLDAIARAQRSIDFLTFIYWHGTIADRFADALSERARAGVRVRVLLDAIGARALKHDFIEQMCTAGCDVRWFRPVDGELGEVNHRTHRKVLICDEVVGFTGGVGIADEWDGDARDESEWRDTHFRVVGPAVDGLRGAFIDNWIETGPHLLEEGIDLFPEHETGGPSTVQVVRGAAETGASDISTLLRLLIRSSQRRVRITTAYFNPEDELVQLLIETVERGVQIEVLVPGPHADKRFVQVAGEATYGQLLDAGISISCFQPSMLHAKILTVDGEVATVGSANVNQRSVQYDEEVNLVIFDPEIVDELDRHFDDDCRRSVALDPEQWAQRSVAQRVEEAVVKGIKGLI